MSMQKKNEPNFKMHLYSCFKLEMYKFSPFLQVSYVGEEKVTSVLVQGVAGALEANKADNIETKVAGKFAK